MKQNTLKTNGLSEKDNNLRLCVDVFLRDRKAQNVTKGTIYFYEKRMTPFLSYCESQNVIRVTDITPDLIRGFLFHLKESGHTEFFKGSSLLLGCKMFWGVCQLALGSNIQEFISWKYLSARIR